MSFSSNIQWKIEPGQHPQMHNQTVEDQAAQDDAFGAAEPPVIGLEE
jgi:hypothetical protein